MKYNWLLNGRLKFAPNILRVAIWGSTPIGPISEFQGITLNQSPQPLGRGTLPGLDLFGMMPWKWWASERVHPHLREQWASPCVCVPFATHTEPSPLHPCPSTHRSIKLERLGNSALTTLCQLRYFVHLVLHCPFWLVTSPVEVFCIIYDLVPFTRVQQICIMYSSFQLWLCPKREGRGNIQPTGYLKSEIFLSSHIAEIQNEISQAVTAFLHLLLHLKSWVLDFFWLFQMLILMFF